MTGVMVKHSLVFTAALLCLLMPSIISAQNPCSVYKDCKTCFTNTVRFFCLVLVADCEAGEFNVLLVL